MAEQSLEPGSAIENFLFDRDIGASYKRLDSPLTDESVTATKLNGNPNALDATYNRQQEQPQGSLTSATGSTVATVFDQALQAAEEWEANKDRFRNPVAEVVDDITDEDVIRTAKQVEMEEKDCGPTMKQLFATLEDERPAKQENDWKALVQQFEIEADNTQCYGCGITLQSNDKDGKGYVDGAVLRQLRDSDACPRCQRCSSMQSGLIFRDNKVALGESAVEAARETVSILRNALSLNESRNVTLVYMMDALDMHFEDGLAELIISRRKQRKAETHLYVVLNKVDLLPPHSRKRVLLYLHRFIHSRAPELNLKPRHIFLMSALNGGGVNLFLSVLMEMAYRMQSKVFFIGATNTGKSTFINRLSRFVAKDDARKPRRHLLSTSVLPGTTLSPLRIDTGQRFNLYDTPGIVVSDSLLSHLTPTELKMAVPSSVAATKTYRLGAGQSLLLGPFVRIDVLAGRPFFFTPHVSKRIQVTQKKTERLQAFLSKQPFGNVRVLYGSGAAGDAAVRDPPPVETTQHLVNITGDGWEKATAELCIKGLGFVTVAGALQLSICIETMRGVSVYMREPLMPFDGIPFLRRKSPKIRSSTQKR